MSSDLVNILNDIRERIEDISVFFKFVFMVGRRTRRIVSRHEQNLEMALSRFEVSNTPSILFKRALSYCSQLAVRIQRAAYIDKIMKALRDQALILEMLDGPVPKNIDFKEVKTVVALEGSQTPHDKKGKGRNNGLFGNQYHSPETRIQSDTGSNPDTDSDTTSTTSTDETSGSPPSQPPTAFTPQQVAWGYHPSYNPYRYSQPPFPTNVNVNSGNVINTNISNINNANSARIGKLGVSRPLENLIAIELLQYTGFIKSQL